MDGAGRPYALNHHPLLLAVVVLMMVTVCSRVLWAEVRQRTPACDKINRMQVTYSAESECEWVSCGSCDENQTRRE